MQQLQLQCTCHAALRSSPSSITTPATQCRWRRSHRQQQRYGHAVTVNHARTYASVSRASKAPPSGPTALYRQRVKQGTLREDPHQLPIVADLQRVYDELLSYEPPAVPEPLVDVGPSSSATAGFFGRIFGRLSSAATAPAIPDIPPNVPKGLYLFGDVGCGKSMLMDLLYEALPNTLGKRRVHFHAVSSTALPRYAGHSVELIHFTCAAVHDRRAQTIAQYSIRQQGGRKRRRYRTRSPRARKRRSNTVFRRVPGDRHCRRLVRFTGDSTQIPAETSRYQQL